MTLKEAKEKLFDLRLNAVKKASADIMLEDKLRLLGEAVAYEKVFGVVCKATERDRSPADVAHTAGLLANRYNMLCGGLEGATEHDSEYYCGQMFGFTKAKELLQEDAEPTADEPSADD